MQTLFLLIFSYFLLSGLALKLYIQVNLEEEIGLFISILNGWYKIPSIIVIEFYNYRVNRFEGEIKNNGIKIEESLKKTIKLIKETLEDPKEDHHGITLYIKDVRSILVSNSVSCQTHKDLSIELDSIEEKYSEILNKNTN